MASRNSKDKGKDITGQGNQAETRGGESPQDWEGPLPTSDAKPGEAEPGVLDDTGSSARITHPDGQ